MFYTFLESYGFSTLRLQPERYKPFRIELELKITFWNCSFSRQI
jgi:hypothetical protein